MPDVVARMEYLARCATGSHTVSMDFAGELYIHVPHENCNAGIVYSLLVVGIVQLCW